MDNTDQPNSICHVQAIQMYQLPNIESQISLPFNLLCGEAVVHSGNSSDGLLVLTNYRLFLQLLDSQHHVPLGLIEIVEHRDLFYLHIGCKDARSFRSTFDNNENCLDWFGRLLKASAPPRQLEELFAFFNYAWTKEKGGEDTAVKMENHKNYVYDDNSFRNEVDRLKFDLHGAWRISSANKNYKLCPSYPPQLLVPACITDETLEIIARFRSSRRIPAVVWRHPGNGAVIARCSQPEVGWLGWRSAEDEDLLKAISDACTFDRGPKTMLDKEYNSSHSPSSITSEDSGQTQPDIEMQDKKKVLIMDARSYTTAVANRARGGGCECPEYYPNCDITFMNLANIHSIRKSFHALRQLCMSSADQPTWFSLLEGTRWLQHMSGLMRAAVTLVTAVERDARPVLVHCSDGWDRTPQIVALAELLLDPYYRTTEGFRVLIEREWLAFGHKFADRCGHATGSDDQNERCPVFLQWLDCIHQLLEQFPCDFEFCQTYLVKLTHHAYSNLFGTFLCNTKQERVERVNDNTFTVWGFLDSPCFKNHLYAPPNTSVGAQVLWPQCNVRDLKLWSEVYLGSLETQSSSEGTSTSCPGPPASPSQLMTKTRSYGDLMNVSDTFPSQIRRCSDPSITVDTIKINSLTIDTPEEEENIRKLAEDSVNQNELEPTNDCSTPVSSDLLNNETDSFDNCNSDCIFKDTSSTLINRPVVSDLKNCEIPADKSDKVLNGDVITSELLLIGPNHFGADLDEAVASNNVISAEKTESSSRKSRLPDAGNFVSICLKSQGDAGRLCAKDDNANQLNGCEVKSGDDVDSDTECTEPSESRSENTVCDVVSKADSPKSVETSTETLVSENLRCSSSPREVNGFEKLSNPDVFCGNGDICKVCAQNIRFVHGKHSHHHSGSTSGKTSRYSTPPLYSRTPSVNEWDHTLHYLARFRNAHSRHCRLGDDGLIPLRCDMQERLWQIIEEHRRKEEALQRELHTYRQALIKQVCHKCSHSEADKLDDTCESEDSSESVRSFSNSSTRRNSQRNLEQLRGSIVDSVCSAGEGQASAVESLRSDMSWEAVEEGPTLPDGIPTLWVPDHAVSRCTGCQTEFWLGRRKHHCRNCGRIFCADCSENSTPLPSEQLYSPVRVCTSCYSQIRRDCGGIPDRCKHTNAQATNTNPQITASSN